MGVFKIILTCFTINIQPWTDLKSASVPQNGTVALCLSLTFLWYDIVEVFYGMVWYGMVCYAILCYGMVWKVWYAMRFQCYAMRFLCFAMLCYAMVYVVKDKHSATVFYVVHPMSVGWDVKLCTVSRITNSLPRKKPFHWISRKSRLLRAVNETSKFQN